MGWTDERIEALHRMWNEGATASQIADELGGVSRNAVIGKAHRLGFYPRSEISPSMLAKVGDLPLGRRTQHLIYNDNIIYVGDLIQKTEAELLRTPNFGRKSLDEVKVALSGLDLRLGISVIGWPPVNFEEATEQFEIARKVSELRQTKGGATFEPAGDHFAMASMGDEDDLAAASKPMTQQMQEVLLQKTRSFVDVAKRLDNQPGWGGISRAVVKLTALLDRPPEEIPSVLGYLYPTTLELGSFLELDQRLEIDSQSYANALEPEVRRPLSDLVRNLAPWLRAFPSVRRTDDEASRFLVRVSELTPTFDVVAEVGKHGLLTVSDLQVFRELRDAVERGEFQGMKAGGRARRSALNLVISITALLGTVYTGAIGSDVATSSPLVHKAGQFLVDTEKSIEALIHDLPHDLKYSILDFMRELSNRPLLYPSPPQVVSSRLRQEARSKKKL